MHTLTSTKGPLGIPDSWIPPNDPGFFSRDIEANQCTINGEPEMVTRTTGFIDNELERTNWVEYRIGDELIHRSAHVTLKPQVIASSDVGRFV